MKCVIAWTVPLLRGPQNPLSCKNGEEDKSLWLVCVNTFSIGLRHARTHTHILSLSSASLGSTMRKFIYFKTGSKKDAS